MRITVGNVRKKGVPIRLDAEITIGGMCRAIFDVSEDLKLSESQNYCLRSAFDRGPVCHPFGHHLIQTIRSLVRLNLLVPEISDDEYNVQKALGVAERERRWVLNKELLYSYVYRTRTVAWLKYTTIQDLEKGQ